MQATRIERGNVVAEEIEREGSYTVAAKLGRERLGLVVVTLEDDPEWEEGDERFYNVETDDEIRNAGIDELRSCIADVIRDMRNARMEEIADELADRATEAVSDLVDAGRAGDVLKALRAAGLI